MGTKRNYLLRLELSILLENQRSVNRRWVHKIILRITFLGWIPACSVRRKMWIFCELPGEKHETPPLLREKTDVFRNCLIQPWSSSEKMLATCQKIRSWGVETKIVFLIGKTKIHYAEQKTQADNDSKVSADETRLREEEGKGSWLTKVSAGVTR